MIIRDIATKDIPELSLLAQKTYADTFGFSMSKEELTKELNENKSVDFFKTAIEKGDNFLIAEKDNQIIGYVGLQKPCFKVNGRAPTENDQALKGIYVDAAYQGQGIGKLLMDAAFEHHRFQEAENVYLCVWEQNKPAYNFYLSYGFKKVGTCDFIVDGELLGQDLVMMKSVK